ncbi:MAG: hypothetical protein GOU97_04265 [Nanoarchaeota archaeon]|nr:hypothetical protein [Nanoarchaeota archaeon]
MALKILYANEYNLNVEYLNFGGIANILFGEVHSLRNLGAEIRFIHSLD